MKRKGSKNILLYPLKKREAIKNKETRTNENWGGDLLLPAHLRLAFKIRDNIGSLLRIANAEIHSLPRD